MYQFESQDASFRCSGQDELCYQLSFVEQNFLLLLYRLNLPICTRNSLPLSRDLSGVFLLSTEARKGKNKQIKHEWINNWKLNKQLITSASKWGERIKPSDEMRPHLKEQVWPRRDQRSWLPQLYFLQQFGSTCIFELKGSAPMFCNITILQHNQLVTLVTDIWKTHVCKHILSHTPTQTYSAFHRYHHQIVEPHQYQSVSRGRRPCLLTLLVHHQRLEGLHLNHPCCYQSFHLVDIETWGVDPQPKAREPKSWKLVN